MPEYDDLELGPESEDQDTTLVKICEVGPRDGLQNEKTLVPLEAKIRYIDMLTDCGFSMMEVGSFVHPKAVPAMADSDSVYSGITRRPGVTYLALVANTRGFERALSLGVQGIAVFTAASELFTQRNIGMSIDESITNFIPIIARARSEGMFIRAYISTAFGCPFEGAIPHERVVALGERLSELGIDELSLGDTIGIATPEAVTQLTTLLESHLPTERLAMHFHDTQGRAIDNITAAFAMGIRNFDSSSGGLGGCPFAPGASGNVATEAVIEHFRAKGIATNIDLPKLQAASRYVKSVLGHLDT